MPSGIESLKVLASLQAASASEDAQDASNKGRELLVKQKELRAKQGYFERAVGDKELTAGEINTLNQMLGELDANGMHVENNLSQFAADDKGKIMLDSGAENKNSRDNATRGETLRKSFEGALKELESQERLDNFGIQELMSRYNQQEQLASSIEKKDSDTKSAIISKIG